MERHNVLPNFRIEKCCEILNTYLQMVKQEAPRFPPIFVLYISQISTFQRNNF
jgi:hypothetical protein